MSKLRIAIVISHPIQHFCPQYASFATIEDIHLKVFFGSALGYKIYTDPNFKKEISWDNLALDKFQHSFLNGDQVISPDKNLDADNLETELLQFAPKLVIGYGYFQKLQRRARRWALKNKVKYAYISDAEGRHHQNFFKGWIKSFILNRYFSRIKFFLTVGDANEAYYRKYNVPQNKMLRMHFPIDVGQYEKSYANKKSLANEIRQRYKIPPDEIIISVVGKLTQWKNQDHIIDAILLLERKKIKLHVFILGSGPMEQLWKQKAEAVSLSQMHLPGFVPIAELPSYYAATDIYVHPAALEPHSIAISEAIYMGCPVVLSDRCGSYGETDDVKVGENGIVFPFGNIDALADAIELLVKDNSMREMFSEASHRRAVRFQECAHKTVIEKLIQLNH